MAKKRTALTSSNTVQNGAKSRTSQSEMAEQSDSLKILDTVELKDGTKVKLNDFIYMRAEIPYEPYYVGRVMEFIPHPKYPKELQVRVAWFYRPKDVFSGRRKHYDPRLLVATMHSDLNPVSSIRGLCSIMHEAHIDGHALEEYKRENDHFYYSQLYDRYCRASYDVVPCANVRNVPGDVAKALQERFEYILVEAGMAGEFTEAHRVCKHCSKWAASTDSLRCAVCASSYHMACLDPPLTKKPTKGYAWQCAVCLRSQKKAKELENSFLQLGDRGAKTAASAAVKLDGNGKLITASNEAPAENETTSSERENITAIDEPDTSITADAALSPARPSTAKRSKGNLQTSESQKWPFRYFGIHTHVNDVFDYDARINPRAASRIGNKYQCNIPAFNSELPVAVPPTIAKTPICSTTASSSTSPVAHRAHSLRLGETAETDSDTVAVVPKPGRGRPRKIPIGGVSVSVKRKDAPEEAGSGDSVVLQRGFDPPVFDWPKNQPGATLDSYIMAVREQTRSFPCPPHSADLLDRALFVLAENEYITEAALKIMEKVERKDLGISFIEWSETEKTKFEDCMMSWGHDLVGAKNYVPEKKSQEIVRYFYSWKKSDRYLPVYGAYAKKFKPNKKFKIRGVPLDPKTGQPMDANSITTEEEDDDDDDDENAPLPDDGTVRVCSNCATNQSPIWRTAPPAHMLGETVVSHVAPHGRSGITKGAAKTLMENDTEGAVKTFCDECSIFWLKYGFLRVLPSKKKEDGRRKDVRDAKAGIPSTEVRQKRTYTKRKKLDVDDDSSLHSPVPVRFKKITGPCDVCQTMEQRHGQHLILCNHCGLTVHVECYGISEASLISSAGKRWACDPCRNSAGPTASTDYSCVLCTPSKRSIKTEPLLCNQFNSDDVIATHRALGDATTPLQAASAISVLNPTKPRALKKTIGNNWAHVLCSAWIPEVKFGDVEIMEPAESIGLIPGWRWKETCSICNLIGGACISCADQCGKHFHFACAIAARYTIGFQTNDGGKGFKSHSNYADEVSEKPITAFMVSSSTSLSPRIWCSDHALKGKKVLKISDLVEDGDRIRTTLAYYIRRYKKCDSFGTGAMRKARFVNTVTGGNGGGGQRRPIIIWSSKSGKRLTSASAPPIVHCVSCGVDASPFWWDVQGSSKALDRSDEFNKEGDVEMEERDPGRENGAKVCHRCHSNRLLAAKPDNSNSDSTSIGNPS